MRHADYAHIMAASPLALGAEDGGQGHVGISVPEVFFGLFFSWLHGFKS